MGVKPIKILTDRMKDENVSNAILVLRGDITPFAKQAVLEMSDSFRIEHFKEAELLVDITEHTLVSRNVFLVWGRAFCVVDCIDQQTNHNTAFFAISLGIRLPFHLRGTGSRTRSPVTK